MRYQNPIFPGFHPDPSICRVGNDFYLVTSTFEFFPGVPVYHSTDGAEYRPLGMGMTVGLCTEGTHMMTFTGVYLGMFAQRGEAFFERFVCQCAGDE